MTQQRIELISDGNPDQYGNQPYHPVVITPKHEGNWGGAVAFDGVDGFWTPPQGTQGQPLTLNMPYVVTLKTKPNKDPSKQPYRDWLKAEPLTVENTPENYETRYTPQGNITATPQGQPAAVAADFSSDGHYEPPQPPKRDPTRESIEVQVFVKECGSMLQVLAAHGTTDLFTPEQVDWLRQNWFDGLYELKHGTPPPAQEEEETA